MLKPNFTGNDVAQAVIQYLESSGTRVKLREQADSFVISVQGPAKHTMPLLLKRTYHEAPDLETAMTSFAALCRVFQHFGSSEELCQNWFTYNITRWARARGTTKEQLHQAAQYFHAD